jgi:hypothetical protein
VLSADLLYRFSTPYRQPQSRSSSVKSVKSVVKNLSLKSPLVFSLCEGVETGSFIFRKIRLDALESLSTEIFEAVDRCKSQDLDLVRRGYKFVVNHLGLGIIKVQLADPLCLQSGGYLIGISRQIR